MKKTAGREKLSFLYKLSYSSASIGLNILAITISTWLLYFYSPPPDSGRTVFLPIGVVGGIMTFISLWDAVIDPFIGHWSDNLRSKLGRRKPFILFSLPFIAGAMMLIWAPPEASTWLVAGFLLLIMLVYSTAYSLAGIPYDATMAELASNNQERISLSSWKSVFGIVGVMVGSLLIAPLFESHGAFFMGAVTAMVGFITILLTISRHPGYGPRNWGADQRHRWIEAHAQEQTFPGDVGLDPAGAYCLRHDHRQPALFCYGGDRRYRRRCGHLFRGGGDPDGSGDACLELPWETGVECKTHPLEYGFAGCCSHPEYLCWLGGYRPGQIFWLSSPWD